MLGVRIAPSRESVTRRQDFRPLQEEKCTRLEIEALSMVLAVIVNASRNAKEARTRRRA